MGVPSPVPLAYRGGAMGFGRFLCVLAHKLRERLERNERIDRKTQLLEQLDPEREFELEGTFTNHVADAIRASSPRGELQQEIDNATEAYENALDEALYEILDKRFAAEDATEDSTEDSSVA